ncbi:hypothetical protein RND81_14G014500 [Saponaria officinalis]|uniref:Transmembrane protein n=1 Tax=Saponaria officinalis TaxID=3572 RepID=A0AAW1GH50_SAPOF
MEPTRLVFLISISLFSSAVAQERSPHGLDHQMPIAFSPSAYEFFHPNARRDPCAKSNCSPLPIATQVHKTGPEVGSTNDKTSVLGVGALAIVAPAFVVLIMFCAAMGTYYLATTCRAKSSLTKALAPDV